MFPSTLALFGAAFLLVAGIPLASEAAAGGSQAENRPAPGGEDESADGFRPGFSFSTVTMDGRTWTRLSLQPEFRFGKLGVALDVELFMDDQQQFSSRGWEFDTPENSLESVLRKIYYVSWDRPGAPFYAKVGALDGVSMAHGLVLDNYGNTARYPDFKLLGTHLQFNNLTALGLDAEVLVNSWQDVQTGGPLVAGRVGFRPLKAMEIPVIGGLLVSAGAARDFSQYAGLRDRDDDGCPDILDLDPTLASICVPDATPDQVFGGDPNLSLTQAAFQHRADSIEADSARRLADRYATAKPFTIAWLEANQPLIQTGFMKLDVYAVGAKPFTGEVGARSGWGLVLPGAALQVGPVYAKAEYRIFDMPFQPGHFNRVYEIERARMVGGEVVTKEMSVYGPAAQEGIMQGFFAGAGADLMGFVEAGGNYSHMFASDNGDDLRSLSGQVGLGSAIAGRIPMLSMAELYWNKQRIGLDRWSDPVSGIVRRDGFFSPSIHTVHGWRIGSQAAPGVMVIVKRETTYRRDATGSLDSETQMSMGTQIRF